MGYQIQPDAPQTSINGKQTAIGAFLWNSAMGVGYKFGVYELGANGWIEHFSPLVYVNEGDFLANVSAKGGIANFTNGFIDRVNTFLAGSAVFEITAVSFPEPTTDLEALTAVQTIIGKGCFLGADIPAQMRADYDSYWTDAIPIGDSRIWSNGSVTKIGAAFAIYSDPAGVMFSLCPISDLNAIAKSNAHIAKAWRDTYGFTPR